MQKEKRITIRFTQEEFQTIIINSNNLSITKSTYCREAIFNTTVTCKRVSLLPLLRELNSIGNNINQIAKHINTHKYIDKTVLLQLSLIEDELVVIKNIYVD